MAKFYVNLDGRTIGPISQKQLIGAARDGQVTAETPVRKGSDGKWVRAKRVHGLFSEARLRDGRQSEDTDAEPSADTKEVERAQNTVSSQQSDSSLRRRKKAYVGTALGAIALLTAVLIVGRGQRPERAVATVPNPSLDQQKKAVPGKSSSTTGAASNGENGSSSDTDHSTVADSTDSDKRIDAGNAEPSASEPSASEPSDSSLAKAKVQGDQLAATFDLVELIAEVEPSIVRIDVEGDGYKGFGSGFVADESGLIVTNHHVIEGATSGQISLNNGSRLPIEGILFADAKRDLAVVKCNPSEPLRVLSLSQVLPRKGEQVAAFGSPEGLDFSASEGIVSAVRTTEDFKTLDKTVDGTWIQTTTPISNGNSGGPLINYRGDVVAVNTMVLASGQNLNFAISCKDISFALSEALNGTLVTLAQHAETPVAGSAEEESEAKASDEEVPDYVIRFLTASMAYKDKNEITEYELPIPELDDRSLRPGMIGFLKYSDTIEVQQMLGDESALVAPLVPVKYTIRSSGPRVTSLRNLHSAIQNSLSRSTTKLELGEWFYLQDENLAGLSDGQRLAASAYEVIGTTSYETVSGATRTVPVLRVFDLERVREYLALFAEAQAEKQAIEQAELRKARAEEATEVWKPIAESLATETVDGLTDGHRGTLSRFMNSYWGTPEAYAANNELRAHGKLILARQYLSQKDTVGAYRKLQQIITEYPDTVSAKVAQRLLNDSK